MAPPNLADGPTTRAQAAAMGKPTTVAKIMADPLDVSRPAQKVLKEDDVWLIHGRTYDLEKFMDQHPGGGTMLRWAKGRNCTELFESYHAFTTKHKQIMAKYEVAPPATLKNYVSYFDWDKTAIYDEIKAAVMLDFKENNITDWKCPTSRYVLIAFLAAVVAAVAVPYCRGEWWTAPVFPLVNWIFGIQVFHCASHSAMSKRPWVNTLGTYMFSYFSSPTTWAHQHVIAHHTHTNIPQQDPDLNHGVPFFRLHPMFRWRSRYQYQWAHTYVFWTFVLIFMSAYLDYRTFVKNSYYGIVPLMHLTLTERKWHLFGRLVANLMVLVPPFLLFSFGKALVFYSVYMAVFSICFMMSTQVNHLIEEAVDQNNRTDDWAVQQIVSSHDFAHDSKWWFLFTGGLNYQIEHHLFPGVNAVYLPRIAPIIKKICAKHNIPYNYSASYTEALGKYAKHITNLSVPPAKDSKVKSS